PVLAERLATKNAKKEMVLPSLLTLVRENSCNSCLSFFVFFAFFVAILRFVLPLAYRLHLIVLCLPHGFGLREILRVFLNGHRDVRSDFFLRLTSSLPGMISHGPLHLGHNFKTFPPIRRTV